MKHRTPWEICVSCVHVCLVAKSCLTLATPWTVACQAPLSMGFPTRILEWIPISFSRGSSRPKYQSHVSRIAGGFFTTEPPAFQVNNK